MNVFFRGLLVLGLLLSLVIIGGGAWLYQTLVVGSYDIPQSALKPPLLVSLEDGRPIVDSDEWEAERKIVRTIFERDIYGNLPAYTATWNIEKHVLDEAAYEGTATVEEVVLVDEKNDIRVPVVLVTPHIATQAPLIIASSFCASHNAFPDYVLEKPPIYPSLCDNSSPDSAGAKLKRFILGRYIESFPVSEMIERGFAFASFYTGSIAPDEAAAGKAALEKFSRISSRPVTGVIATWAFGYLQVMHELEKDPRIDSERIALYGHSRDGKAALLAGAFDPSVDAVIAHQSGTGGAAPAKRAVGESIASIMREYSFWFDETFLRFAGHEGDLSLDQHFLIALNAPHPVLLTGASLDKWADPVGAFMAERDASYIYDLYEPGSFSAEKLDDFHPEDSLAFFMRDLNHGVRRADWEAFLAFFDAHFSR